MKERHLKCIEACQYAKIAEQEARTVRAIRAVYIEHAEGRISTNQTLSRIKALVEK